MYRLTNMFCRGNAEEAIKHAAHVISHHFETPWTEHAFLEPECAVAFPYKDGVKVYSTDQGVYDTRKEISIMLGWDPGPGGCGKQAGGRRLRRQGGHDRPAAGRAHRL